MICFLLIHTETEETVGDGWINGGGGGGKGYVGPAPSKIMGGGASLLTPPPSTPPVSKPMQVSLSSEIIFFTILFFCDRVSCSHGLNLEDPHNEQQPLATLSYIMDLLITQMSYIALNINHITIYNPFVK